MEALDVVFAYLTANNAVLQVLRRGTIACTATGGSGIVQASAVEVWVGVLLAGAVSSSVRHVDGRRSGKLCSDGWVWWR